MKTKDWFKQKINTLHEDFDFRLETLILELTENICEQMKRQDINRTEFAKCLNISPPAVTKILNGSSNFTLRTLLSIANALECDLVISFSERNKAVHTLDTLIHGPLVSAGISTFFVNSDETPVISPDKPLTFGSASSSGSTGQYFPFQNAA